MAEPMQTMWISEGGWLMVRHADRSIECLGRHQAPSSGLPKAPTPPIPPWSRYIDGMFLRDGKSWWPDEEPPAK